MAKFNFPISNDVLVKAFQSIAEDLKKLANSDTKEEAIAYAISCIRMGWGNKQHHKASQSKRQETERMFNELVKKGDARALALKKEIDAKRGV